MKTIKLLTLLFALLVVTPSFAGGGKEKAVIQTSAVCESCQYRIEKALNAIDGVSSATLNLDNKKVTVKYDPIKVNLDTIKKTIAETGYDADDVKATADAVKKLPGCCQPNTGKKCEHK